MATDQKTSSASSNLSFIRSNLDDRGLRLAEFRIYCRILRRGICTETIKDMAARCRMHPDTVHRAVKSLVAMMMVEKVRRYGSSSKLQATTPDNWLPVNKGEPSNAG